jgi:hypothetical protein
MAARSKNERNPETPKNMSTLATRKADLETQLGIVAQLAQTANPTVEITVRALDRFTLSAEGDATENFKRVKAFLVLSARITEWECTYDQECDMTFAYFTVAA